MKHAFTHLLCAFALSGCGASVGVTTGPLAPETPGLTAGPNRGGSGCPADPLAAFTTQVTFTPVAHQGLEIISISGTTPTVEANPALTFQRTTTGLNMTLSQGTVQYDTRTGSGDITGTNTYRSCITSCAGSGLGLVPITTIFTSGAASTLTYSTYGAWTRIESVITLRGVGVFATGTPTVLSNLPTMGGGNFSGNATGFVITGNTATNVSFSGTATFNTDFAARTISGSVTNITTTNIATPATTGTLSTMVFGSGTYSGNTFTGMAATLASSGTDAVDLTGATGQFSGIFYGPNAIEAAGSFAMTKTGVNVIGAFGVKR
ncbi:MAG: transferrin-binding protein-like solute binding protein [Rhodospirillaceae bacterium]|nr:transferrin-binding protein-like solute binding protein [Rhodospirillaceae bacterium]